MIDALMHILLQGATLSTQVEPPLHWFRATQYEVVSHTEARAVIEQPGRDRRIQNGWCATLDRVRFHYLILAMPNKTQNIISSVSARAK